MIKIIDLDQKIVKKWWKNNKKYYIDKGYLFTGIGDEFFVKVRDLPLNATDIVCVTCDYCGKEIQVKYKRYNDNIKKYGKYACTHCNQQRSLTERQDKIYSKIEKFCSEHNYALMTKKSEITSRLSNITYICPIHGERTVQASSMLEGHGCYYCSREIACIKHWDYSLNSRIKKYYQMAKDKCTELGYELISKEGDFTKYEDYVKYKCPLHGIHEMRFGNLVSGKSCPDCGHPKSIKISEEKSAIKKPPKNKLTSDEVIRRVEKCGGTILNPEDYINQYERNLIISCPRCGKPFTTSLVLFTQHGGQVCEDCYRKESVGERRIRKYLEVHNIPFTPEGWFPDCRDMKPLPFDFHLYTLNTIIEFDGSQHFRDGKKYFHKSYDYDICAKHDEIKNKYCIEHNIKLIRIPYWQIDKIDEILDKEIYYSHEDIV